MRKLTKMLQRKRMIKCETKGNAESLCLEDIGIKGKIFCLSMQRSGTSSVGQFFEQWGLKHATMPMSQKQKWPRYWFEGDYERIFSDPLFAEHEVFEDSPFWFPDFYKYIFRRVPGSKFILLYRDSDAWFKSMIRHSKGFTLGRVDIHAKVYRREGDLKWLERNIPGFEGGPSKAMTLFDKAPHYKACYERHTDEVESFFRNNAPDDLFVAKLSDPDVWGKISDWLSLPIIDGVKLHSHAHKAKGELTKDSLLVSHVRKNKAGK